MKTMYPFILIMIDLEWLFNHDRYICNATLQKQLYHSESVLPLMLPPLHRVSFLHFRKQLLPRVHLGESRLCRECIHLAWCDSKLS